ncbi:hypothetical protein SUGI_0906500 [Cryptomeria japonica]|uniref:ethylene-responsive transcription factor ERF024-like n=1 Tax=Cryptomeria japonica TaxID=3369 RepID=UPI00241474EA|nr:ethylene-responsive transcription factor ERF024-like [Cryptomeria japonica]GLJ43565.1 hypothetical protein SUGI_0906500 [Cryptomeria japonica]
MESWNDRKDFNSEEERNRSYRGVRRRSWGKWVSEIRQPGTKSRIWLGSYDKPHMAARAYDVAAVCLKGKSALPNFPHLIHTLPRPASLDPRDIQSAAAKAALSFRHYSHVTTALKNRHHSSIFMNPPQPCPSTVIEASNEKQSQMLNLADPIQMEEAQQPNCFLDDDYGKVAPAINRIRTEFVQFDDELRPPESPNLVTNMAEALLLTPPRFDESSDYANISIYDDYYIDSEPFGFLWSGF